MYSIGVAAARSGVSIEAIRYYERDGVVPKAVRLSNGRRTYDEAAIARLRFIRRGRDLGFSISQIKDLILLAESDEKSCSVASQIGGTHLTEVREKIANLRRLETALVELLGNCADGQPNCPMLTRLFDDQ
ncbi:MAG: MerR family transcriptional regulator [Alphaproteobacteria bacterium]